MMPIRIALRRSAGASPAAAMPMTMALSPASTRSIMMTCRKALKLPDEKISKDRPVANAAKHNSQGLSRHDAWGFHPRSVQIPRSCTCYFAVSPRPQHQTDGLGHSRAELMENALVERQPAQSSDNHDPHRPGRRNDRRSHAKPMAKAGNYRTRRAPGRGVSLPGHVIERIGGCARTRTVDPLIKSQLLYHLSYAPGPRG